jgi:hypothetical protein
MFLSSDTETIVYLLITTAGHIIAHGKVSSSQVTTSNTCLA